MKHVRLRLLKPSNVLQVLAWSDHFVSSCEGALPSAPPLLPPHLEGTKVDRRPLLRSNSHPFKTSLSLDLKKRLRGRLLKRSTSETTACCTNLFSSLCRTPPPSDGLLYDLTAPLVPTYAMSDPTFCCRVLVSQCLVHIDSNIDSVLTSQTIECLPAHVLTLVLSRDTLTISSETLVIDALYRWSSDQCRKRHKPLTLAHRRAVLGKLLTLPRLLTLSLKDLNKMDPLYDTSEISYVKAYLKGRQCPPVPPLFTDSVDHLAVRRCVKVPKPSCRLKLYRRISRRNLFMDLFSLFALVID